MLQLLKRHNIPVTFLLAYIFSAYEVLEDIVINASALNLVRPIALIKNIGSNFLFVILTLIVLIVYIFINSIFQKDYPKLKQIVKLFFSTLVTLLPFFIFFGVDNVYEFICDSFVSFKENLLNSPQYFVFIILLAIYLIIDFTDTILKFSERIGILLYPFGIMANLVAVFVITNIILTVIFIYIHNLKIMEIDGTYVLSIFCSFLILEYYLLLIYREIQTLRGKEYINFD
jgi:hypothetical protein